MAMKNPTKTYRLALIGVMTAILCILGPLSIPCQKHGHRLKTSKNRQGVPDTVGMRLGTP